MEWCIAIKVLPWTWLGLTNIPPRGGRDHPRGQEPLDRLAFDNRIERAQDFYIFTKLK